MGHKFERLTKKVSNSFNIKITKESEFLDKFNGVAPKGSVICGMYYPDTEIYGEWICYHEQVLKIEALPHLVLFHELTHATAIRLNRPLVALSEPPKEKDVLIKYNKADAEEELIAEITAQMLLDHYKITWNNLKPARKMFTDHFRKFDPNLRLVHKESNKAFEYILNNID